MKTSKLQLFHQAPFINRFNQAGSHGSVNFDGRGDYLTSQGGCLFVVDASGTPNF
jgi:hypothetical protein